MQRVRKNAGAGFFNVTESGISISYYVVNPVVSKLKSRSKSVLRRSDVGPRKGVMENSIII